MLRRTAVLITFFVTATASLSAQDAAAKQPPAAYLSDAKFLKAVEAAKVAHQPADERLDHWKKANKVANNQCVECLHQIVMLDLKAAEYKDAISAATQLDAVTTDKQERFFAEAERGVAYVSMNEEKPKPDQLALAVASLQSALQLAPTATNVLYTEGRAFALAGRNDEAKEIFAKYVATTPVTDKYHGRAERFAEDPHLAALRMAPPFSLRTQTGEQMALDDMRGKVVLLDFWATWCGPCKETLPEVQSIAKRYEGQPLVVLSISIDKDGEAWSKFIEKNHMDWPQFRDANGSLSTLYGAQSIPRFFTIDTNGVLQSVKVGSGADINSEISRLVNKAKDAEKKRAREAEKATGQ